MIKSAMWVTIENNYNVTSAEAKVLPLNKIQKSFGSNLTLSNGNIRIGKGVSAVIVSGSVYFQSSVNGIKVARIALNGSTIFEIYYNFSNQERYQTIGCPGGFVPVTESSTISLIGRSVSGDIIWPGHATTYLNVIALG